VSQLFGNGLRRRNVKGDIGILRTDINYLLGKTDAPPEK